MSGTSKGQEQWLAAGQELLRRGAATSLSFRGATGRVLRDALIVSIFWVLLLFYRRETYRRARQVALIGALFSLTVLGAAVVGRAWPQRPELIPIPFVAVMLTVLFNGRVSMIAVMVLGGLWHGAAYTFVAWGALHGLALALERGLGLHRDRGWAHLTVVRAVWFLVVQTVVLVAWVCFRSTSMAEARAILSNIASLDQFGLGAMELFGLLFLLPLVLHHAFAWLVERGHARPLAPAHRAVLAACMVYAIATLYTSSSEFIYFQF